MDSLAQRIDWVVRKERVFPSLRQWALATEALGPERRVAVNTLNDLRNKPNANPETETIRSLAAVARRDDGCSLSVAWLQFGIGSPFVFESEDDPVYPSRTHVVQALVASGSPSAVVERLRKVGGFRVDPGKAYWHRKAAEFLDDFDRLHDQDGIARS